MFRLMKKSAATGAGSSSYRADCLLIVLGGVSLFYYLALFSFHPYDRSWLAVSAPALAPSNAAGLVGSYLASFVLFHLGAVAFLLPGPALLLLFLRFLLGRRPALGAFGMGTITGLGVASFTAARLAPTLLVHDIPLPGGGRLGEGLMASGEQLLGRSGSVLAAVVGALLSLLLLLQQGFLVRRLSRRLDALRRHITATAVFRTPEEPTGTANPGWRRLWLGRRLAGMLRASLMAPRQLLTRAFGRERRTLRPCSAQGREPGLLELPPEPGIFAAPQRAGPPAGGPASLASAEPAAMAELFRASAPGSSADEEPLHETGHQLLAALADFKIGGEIVDYQKGPLVTTYAFRPEKGTKQASITKLINDLALALRVESLFVHPIPEKSALGFQIPNRERQLVRFADFVHSAAFSGRASTARLPLLLGKTVSGEIVCEDLAEMPHLLIAGSTGSGKSVGIHSLICSLLMKVPADELRLILIDPKMLELTYYEGLKQLLLPVLTKPEAAVAALEAAVATMEKRYEIMQKAQVRHIADFNRFWRSASAREREELAEATGCPELDCFPYQVIVIDELADLMMTAARDIETIIARLAQKARASGIHMILATQRPSVDVLTGTIKANLPSRLSYRLVSSHDSRTIIDQVGAEKLLGRGDLLFQKPASNRLTRLHGAYIEDEEIKALTSYLKS